MFLAQASTFWSKPVGSLELKIWIGVGFILGIAFLFFCMQAPVRSRKWIIASVTFVGGAFWVLRAYWPEPAFKGPNDVPSGFVEGVGFWIQDAIPKFSNFANIISGFLLGLGTYSLVRIHLKRIGGGHKDRVFSVVLLASALAMFIVHTWDWRIRKFYDEQNLLGDVANWGFWQYAKDLLFDGMNQVMEAAMFSMIAFFILSAAYRAFRLRSIEATILLTAAVIMIFSLMGHLWAFGGDQVMLYARDHGLDPTGFVSNLKPKSWTDWLTANLQTPGIRAVDLGLGVGVLAMGLRLWLSLEKGVGNS